MSRINEKCVQVNPRERKIRIPMLSKQRIPCKHHINVKMVNNIFNVILLIWETTWKMRRNYVLNAKMIRIQTQKRGNDDEIRKNDSNNEKNESGQKLFE